MPRLATLIACLLLVFPAAAFAQGAGDDQYQDPFGDEPAQNDGGGSDGGLSDEPPVPSGGGSDSGSGSGGGDTAGGGGTTGGGDAGSGTAPSTGTTTTPATGAEATDQLPNTGSEPLLIMGLGVAFVLTGAGLRLRTIDPDAF